MATLKRFEDLDCWKVSLKLCNKVGELIDSGSFEKHFRLIGQIEGSSGSIMDNIAEGFERSSKIEFINSLTIAKGEAGELKSQLYRGLDNNYFSKELFETLYNLVDEITKMITSLILYLNKSKTKGQKFKDRV